MADSIGFKPTSVNVQGLTALIRNLGRDCTPEQFMREFVQNSIEACERTGLDDRHILIDYNHSIQKHSGIFKICFTDNGDGMTLEQMNNLLNSISASGECGNTYENYGVGAKISSLTRNHFGVQYESWRHGVGNSIIIRYNPKYDMFGIQGFPDEKGQIQYYRPIADSLKPDFIKEHGTRVTLFGDNIEQDTMAPPLGVHGEKSTWLYEYLNKRYFELPSDIAIDVRIGYEQDINNSQLHRLARLEGFRDSLVATSNHHGVVQLRDAKAHWFLLKTDSPIKGHSGLMNQGEIFNVEGNWSNRLTHFGILLGRDGVVIIVEPKEASQNIARTHLKRVDGSEFYWQAWQEEFRANLPAEIKAYLENLLRQRNKASSSRAVQNRLMVLSSFFNLAGFIPLMVLSPIDRINGDELPSGDAAKDDPQHDEPESDMPDEPEKPPQGLAQDPLKDSLDRDGAQDDQESFFPRVEWTTEAQSPQLAGRAAEFIEYSNIILANEDFKGLQDIFKYFTDQYDLSDERLKSVRNIVLENAEQALMETVAGVLSLKSEPHWGGIYQQAFTKEALSAVLMQRYWSVKAVEDGLSEIMKAQAH
jgi:hypothetical protein